MTVVGDATPSGKLTLDCYETIAGEILAGVDKLGGVEAILLNLHGAMVAEHVDDGEGELIARLRAKAGPKAIIAATLDLHANVTDRMAEHADIIVSYRTYPHVDMYDIATIKCTYHRFQRITLSGGMWRCNIKSLSALSFMNASDPALVSSMSTPL